jgi:hypothetical protein
VLFSLHNACLFGTSVCNEMLGLASKVVTLFCITFGILKRSVLISLDLSS